MKDALSMLDKEQKKNKKPDEIVDVVTREEIDPSSEKYKELNEDRLIDDETKDVAPRKEVTEATAPEIFKRKEVVSENPEADQTVSSLKKARYLVDNKLIPKGFTTEAQIFLALTTATALGFTGSRSFLALQNLMVVNGRVSMWGDLPFAMVRERKLIEDMEEFLIDAEQNKICLENKNLEAEHIGAICRMKRFGEKWQEHYVPIKDIEHLSKDDKKPIWKDHPKTMLQRRVRGKALKFVFPDVIIAVDIKEYSSPDKETEKLIKTSNPVEDMKDKKQITRDLSRAVKEPKNV